VQFPQSKSATDVDVILIGAGIMSATLGMMLKLLEPELRIAIYERLDIAAAESSDAWNNAGTGHAAFCELNYTPEQADGTVATAKAIKIAESFDISRQFWATLVEQQIIADPAGFITQVPHLSFVRGSEDIRFLQRRYQALQQSPLFGGMIYSEDRGQLGEWMPLIMQGRSPSEAVAATAMAIGTDVNFGALTRHMFEFLQHQPAISLQFATQVEYLERAESGAWRIGLSSPGSSRIIEQSAAFVFIGAGGGSLPLLLKSGIPEAKGYGGFPVGGQWLVCRRPELIGQHHAKVYGKAAIGAPPMSVPHLDTRIINGERALLFGPYAGFSTKFLKQGSLLDLPLSVRATNVVPMLAAGLDNLALTKYLIEQVTQSPEDRLATLRAFVPTAMLDDWQLEIAGQRVQVIKHDEEQGGILEFGTEVVCAGDGSLATLLGASPGASTAVSIMLDLIKRCFPEAAQSAAWQTRLRQLIPSYGQSLAQDAALLAKTRDHTSAVLQLT
jgi:malate dehydrogenase (quinone)